MGQHCCEIDSFGELAVTLRWLYLDMHSVAVDSNWDSDSKAIDSNSADSGLVRNLVMCSDLLQITAVADDVENNNKHRQLLSAELSCATRIITLLIRLWLNLCPADIAVLEAALTSEVNDATNQVDLCETVKCSVSVDVITGVMWCHNGSSYLHHQLCWCS